jgi:hypothetical protein
VVCAEPGIYLENYGPPLFRVSLKSPPIGEIFVKWQEVLRINREDVVPVGFTLRRRREKVVQLCGPEVGLVDSGYSEVPIAIVCQDEKRCWWEGAGTLVYDQTTRQWSSVGFDEMRPLVSPAPPH